MPRLLWKSPLIPAVFLEDEDLLQALRAEAGTLAAGDDPSRSDLAFLIAEYNDAPPEVRDGMDAAIVWMTGYTLHTISRRVLEMKQYGK